MRIYRASGLGGCIKAQVAAQLEYTALKSGELDSNLSYEGNLHEDDIIARFYPEDVARQVEVNLDVMPNVVVQGHVDGLSDHVVEVKSMGRDPYKAWLKDRWDTPGLVQKYKWQISVYMHATGLPCTLYVKCRDNGKIDIDNIDEPFYSLQEIRGRVLEIEKWVRRDELPVECDIKNFPCPFFYLEEQLSLDLMEDDTIDELARMYHDASMEVKRAEGKKKEARKALDTGMGDRDKVTTANSRVTYFVRKGSKVDLEKMREDGVDVKKYEVPTNVKQLRVTVKDEDGSDESRGDGEGTQSDRATVEEPRQD